MSSIPRPFAIKLDDKIGRVEFESGSPAVTGKADKSQTFYVMPFSLLPQPRPSYAGPVLMQIPEEALSLVTFDGTTEGGGGLVRGLDWVITRPAAEEPADAVVTPNSISSVSLLGSPQVTRLNTPGDFQVVFGMNYEAAATVGAWATGRRPISRWFYGRDLLPATFNANKQGGADDKRAHVSFKWLPSQVIAGQWDARFDSYVSSVPRDWQLTLTLWHEPNDEFRSGTFTVADWKNANIRLSNRLVALGVTSRIKICPLLIGPYSQAGVTFDNAWMMTPDQLHDGALWGSDMYGNPFPSGGTTGLDTPYPAVSQGLDQLFTRLETYGWWDNWCLGEWNTPRRNWDATEADRVVWLEDFVDYAVTGGDKPPRHMLFWEGNARWDQFLKTNTTKNFMNTVFARSPVR